ncbi:MAG: SH3 domain-containing protein [Aggregatilineales bacterium]
MKRMLVLVMLIFIGAFVVTAQNDTDTCPTIVEQVLETVDEACTTLGRNQICYGNNLIDARNFQDVPISTFASVGDTTDVLEIASLVTAPFDLSDETWGIAMMALQANLPDTIPGQNVIFVVFGDAEISNQVVPEDQIISNLEATSTSNVNLRAGTGTTFDVVGTLTTNEVITINGRNSAGDWLRLETEDGTAWVFASLISTEGDVSLLPVVGGDDSATFSAPMQAFSLSTGLGQSACDEVPPDGVLVQAPTETTVNFLINGVEVQVGSTAFLQVREGVLYVSTFDGSVTITSAGESQIIEPGYFVRASDDTPPSDPLPYDYDGFWFMPTWLLPENVGIPLLVGGNSNWQDSYIEVDAGDTFTLHTGGLINFWDFCETQKVANGQPDIDCSTLIFGPAGGDPSNESGESLPSDTSVFPAPDAPPHSLVGRIGDSTFYVGDGGTFTAPESGTLSFRANDIDQNNFGFFFVRVIVEE